MEYEIYAVKDTVSGQFSRIELFNNEQVAIRYYNGLLAESKIAKDLQFFRLGTYNLETGVIKSKVKFIQGGLVSE